MIKSYKHIIILFLGFGVTVVAYFWFITTPWYPQLQEAMLQNPTVTFVSLVIIKAVGLIWPPLPGGVLTIAAIPIIGWFPAFLADFVGSIIGSSVAYYLAAQYGYPFLEKIFDKVALQKMKKFKIKKSREFESMFIVTLAGGTVIELIAYAVGLVKLNYWKFLLARVLTHAIVGIPFYLLIGNALTGRNLLLNLTAITLAVIFFAKFKNRYIE